MNRRYPGLLLAWCLVLRLTSAPACADAPPDASTDPNVDAAIKKGCDYLLGQFDGNGGFHGQWSAEIGHTALIVYALRSCDVPADNPAIQGALASMLKYARGTPAHDSKGVYNASLVLMALDTFRPDWHAVPPSNTNARGTLRLDDAQTDEALKNLDPKLRAQLGVRAGVHQSEYARRLEDARKNNPYYAEAVNCAGGLITQQGAFGSFNYGQPGDIVLDGDLSNTQYALLGLWAAERGGVPIPARVWTKCASHTADAQKADGGWGYLAGAATTRAMTVAGISCLAICYRQITHKDITRSNDLDPPSAADKDKKATPRRPPVKPPLLRKIDAAFTALGGLGLEELNGYYLYGLERACALTQTRQVAGIDWYQPLADKIVAAQQADGQWNYNSGYGTTPTTTTSWTLLFLVRATRKVIPYHYSGSPAAATIPAR
jgi:hypothetical protein